MIRKVRKLIRRKVRKLIRRAERCPVCKERDGWHHHLCPVLKKGN